MRVWRIVLIVLVILGGLFVAADRIAVSVVQSKAAERVQITEGLDEKPKVSIEGFPFLTQLLFGKLDDVKVKARDINAGAGGTTVRIQSFDADLRGVKFSDSFRRAVADTADGVVFISYDDLSKAAPDGVTVSAAPAAADGTARVKLSASIPELGDAASVYSDITVKGDSVSVKAEQLPKAVTALGLEGEVRKTIDFSRQLGNLPHGITLQKVTGTPDGISIQVGGQDVELAG